MELSKDEPLELFVEPEDSGMRLDAWLAQRLPRYSRVLLRQAITNGGVTIGEPEQENPLKLSEDEPSLTGQAALVPEGVEFVEIPEPVLKENFFTRRQERRQAKRGLAKPAFRLKPGQRISIVLPELPRSAPIPEEIPLEILYEDESLVVINKPYGMVVHPSRGHWAGTLVGALAYHFQDNLSTVRGTTRPGIVHRLDRDTSGVIVVAKTDFAHMKLAEQFANRQIEKEYVAIVCGAPVRDRDVIEAPIGPHPHQTEKMAIRMDCPDAKPAKTFYEVMRRYRGYTLLKALPKTGRTHQIRLHFMHAGFPILCDRLYGGRAEITQKMLDFSLPDETVLNRQALHARRLKFTHPETGEVIEVVAPLPPDMKEVLKILEQYR